ncbi:MAG: hypothetical protein FWE19_08230 [Oscillospiraceae bacterium]|nr:hypothetical protein [Oscillospiraceae bacterium]
MDEFRAVVSDTSGVASELTPSFIRLRRSLESPADGFTGRFPVSERLRELVGVRLFRGQAVVFEGKIDAQRLSISQDGTLLTLEARSKGGLLLDNQAAPHVYENITTHGLFEWLCAPHGFLLLASPRTLPEFTVRAGQTLWAAFCAFTRRTYGRLPFVVGDMVIVSQADPGASEVIGDERRPFSRLEQTISHYRPISRMFIRGEDGEYSTFVQNHDAPPRGIVRERFMVPSGEFVSIPQWDATSRIRRSMREMERVVVELPGFHELRPGSGAVVDNPAFFMANLLVDESVFTLDAGGARTQLALVNSVYD